MSDLSEPINQDAGRGGWEGGGQLFGGAAGAGGGMDAASDATDYARDLLEADRERMEAVQSALAFMTTDGDHSGTIGQPLMAAGMEAAAQAHEQTSNQAHEQTSNQAPTETAASAPKQPVPPPTGLEVALAGMVQDGGRKEKFIMMGDPAIQQRFLQTLQETNRLGRGSGGYVFDISTKDAMKLYEESARKVAAITGGSPENAVAAVPALQMTLRREADGWLGGKLADLKHRLRLDHEITVMVAGTPDVREAKLQELGKMVEQLQGQGFFAGAQGTPDKPLVVDGKLNLDAGPEGKPPVKLESTKQMGDLVVSASIVVQAYEQQEAEKTKNRTEARNARDDEAYSKLAEKKAQGAAEGTATAPAGSAPAVAQASGQPLKLSGYAKSLHTTLQDAVTNYPLFQAPSSDDPKKDTATRLMDYVRGLKDPAEPELAVLPEAQRADALARLQVLVHEIDAGRMSKAAATALDKPAKDGGPSAREKLDLILAHERASTPGFVEEMRGAMQSIKIATETYPEDPRYHSAHAFAEQYEKELATGVATATFAKTDIPVVGAYNDAPAAPELAAPESAKPDTRPLDERLAAMAASRPAEVDARLVAGLLAELDGRQAQPVTQVAPGEGAKPLETLTRIEGLLTQAGSGRFGPEAQALAENLQGTVQGWKVAAKQNYDQAQEAIPGGWGTDVARVRAAEPEWHAAPAAAKALPEPEQVRSAGASSELPADLRKEPAALPTEQVVTAEAKATSPAPVAAAVEVLVAPGAARTQEVQGAPAQAPAQATPGAAPAAAPPAGQPGSPVAAAAAKEADQSLQQQTVSVQAQKDTEAAVSRISRTMANPAGMLTTADKQWDTKAVDRVAKAVTKLDAAAVAKLPAQERTALHAQARWVATQAAKNRLPGFSSEAGRAQVAAMQAKVAELAPLASGETGATVAKQLAKADNAVQRMAERERGVSPMSTVAAVAAAAPVRSDTPANHAVTQQAARDMVDIVYNGADLSEAKAKYLLKEAAQFTPETLKGLDPDTRARTVAAVEELTRAVTRDLGGFEALSPAVQRHVTNAQGAADKLHDAYKADSEMQAPMVRARQELALPEAAEHARQEATKQPAAKAQAASLER